MNVPATLGPNQSIKNDRPTFICQERSVNINLSASLVSPFFSYGRLPCAAAASLPAPGPGLHRQRFPHRSVGGVQAWLVPVCIPTSQKMHSCFHRSIKSVRSTPKPLTQATILNNGSVTINLSCQLRAPTACVQSLQRSVRINLSATIGPNQSVCKQWVQINLWPKPQEKQQLRS